MREKLAVGEVTRPQGLKGALRVQPWLDDADVYGRITEVFPEQEPGRRLEVESFRQGGKGAVVWKFRGVDSPEEAEKLRGAVLLARRDVLRGPEEGVFYWEDFEGRDVFDEAGERLGRVEDMMGVGGNDVLIIRTPEGEELLVPATREVVLRREGDRWIFRPPLVDEETEGEPDAL